MRQQRITNRGEPIFLGYKGETNATQIIFDIPDDWQDGVVQLYFLRMSDTDAYVPTGFYIENGIAYWNVSSEDISVVGNGLAQYCSISNGRITKTRAFKTITEKSADDTGIIVPAPQKNVLDASLEAASTFAAQAQTAANKAENAAQSAQGAIYEWFTLSVDEETGQLQVTERNRTNGNV